MIIADIDDFKKVNDTYGHETGDKVLVAVSKIFKEFVRGSDFVCRWGGEEILILMPVCTKKQAKRVGIQLLEEVQTAEIESTKGEKVTITITMGQKESSSCILSVLLTGDCILANVPERIVLLIMTNFLI